MSRGVSSPEQAPMGSLIPYERGTAEQHLHPITLAVRSQAALQHGIKLRCYHHNIKNGGLTTGDHTARSGI